LAKRTSHGPSGIFPGIWPQMKYTMAHSVFSLWSTANVNAAWPMKSWTAIPRKTISGDSSPV
jgi:hypothetical protein